MSSEDNNGDEDDEESRGHWTRRMRDVSPSGPGRPFLFRAFVQASLGPLVPSSASASLSFPSALLVSMTDQSYKGPSRSHCELMRGLSIEDDGFEGRVSSVTAAYPRKSGWNFFIETTC